MNSHIPFHFYITDLSHPLALNSPLSKAPIPSSRLPWPEESGKSCRVTYGDYFSAVKSFLSGDGYKPLLLAVSSCSLLHPEPEYIEAIRIFLVKHGEFYHPSRIETDIGGNCYKFVLNVAVTAEGIALMDKEYNLLDHLGRFFPYVHIPRAYDMGRAKTSSGQPVTMFIGEWFDGFCEFHLSHNPAVGHPGIVVWDEEKGFYFLDEAQTHQLYKEIALILTAYYNPFTFEHIFSWNHAAGDFITKKEKDKLSVKLISIRNYGPMLENVENRLETVLDGLLIFLLNLSIRLRIDRLDGVGDYAWAGEWAVQGAVSGFFNGLDRQVVSDLIPLELVQGFNIYLSAFKKTDLLEWMVAIIDGYHHDAPGMPLIRKNLSEHVKELYDALKKNLSCV